MSHRATRLLWPLALLGFVAHRLNAALRAPFGGDRSSLPAVWLLIGALLVAGSIPLSIEASRRQPQRVSVDDMRDGLSPLTNWVRVEGRIMTLSSPSQIVARRRVTSMLVEPGGDAILLYSDVPIEGYSSVTGELGYTNQASRTAAVLAGEEVLEGIDLIQNAKINVDEVILPEREVNWLPVWLPLGAAALLIIGMRAGYPIFLRSSSAPERSTPLPVGEPLVARIVDDRDQSGARLVADEVVLVRVSSADEPGARGLTVQRAGTSRRLTVYADRWISAYRGTLLTLSGASPALLIQSWGVNAMLVFRSARDRDRAAEVLRPAPATEAFGREAAPQPR
jgi:hypothetical protein